MPRRRRGGEVIGTGLSAVLSVNTSGCTSGVPRMRTSPKRARLLVTGLLFANRRESRSLAVVARVGTESTHPSTSGPTHYTCRVCPSVYPYMGTLTRRHRRPRAAPATVPSQGRQPITSAISHARSSLASSSPSSLAPPRRDAPRSASPSLSRHTTSRDASALSDSERSSVARDAARAAGAVRQEQRSGSEEGAGRSRFEDLFPATVSGVPSETPEACARMDQSSTCPSIVATGWSGHHAAAGVQL